MWLLGLLYVIDTAADRLEQEKKGRVPPPIIRPPLPWTHDYCSPAF